MPRKGIWGGSSAFCYVSELRRDSAVHTLQHPVEVAFGTQADRGRRLLQWPREIAAHTVELAMQSMDATGIAHAPPSRSPRPRTRSPRELHLRLSLRSASDRQKGRRGCGIHHAGTDITAARRASTLVVSRERRGVVGPGRSLRRQATVARALAVTRAYLPTTCHHQETAIAPQGWRQGTSLLFVPPRPSLYRGEDIHGSAHVHNLHGSEIARARCVCSFARVCSPLPPLPAAASRHPSRLAPRRSSPPRAACGRPWLAATTTATASPRASRARRPSVPPPSPVRAHSEKRKHTHTYTLV